MVHFLDLPLEIRREVYSYLLVIPDYSKFVGHSISGRRLSAGTGILATCRQINAEAEPVLYGSNLFLADQRRLTKLARLRAWSRPFSLPDKLALIRRWWLSVPHEMNERVPPHLYLSVKQCDWWYGPEDARAAFTGVEELVLELLYYGPYYPPRLDSLRRFERVRGVKVVRIVNCPEELEGYCGWLKRAMTSPVGSEVQPYIDNAQAQWDTSAADQGPIEFIP